MRITTAGHRGFRLLASNCCACRHRDFISSTVKMNQNEIKSCTQLNKKASLLLQVGLILSERKKCCKYYYYYYLYYYCCQCKYSRAISISKVETIYYLTYQNTSLKKTNVVVRQCAEEKNTSRKAGTLHQLQMKINIIYSYDKLVTEPTLAYCQLNIPS